MCRRDGRHRRSRHDAVDPAGEPGRRRLGRGIVLRASASLFYRRDRRTNTPRHCPSSNLHRHDRGYAFQKRNHAYPQHHQERVFLVRHLAHACPA
jgi:hypothetical protein